MDDSNTTAPPPQAQHGGRYLLFRVLRVLAVLTLCAAALNGVLDYGHRGQMCVRCSASSSVRELYILGVGGQWGRSIELRRLAKFIEKHDGQPCAHRWVTCWRESGNVLYRRVEFEAGRLEGLYSMMNTTELDLDKMQEQDPSFLAQLKNAIRRPESPPNQALIEALTSDFRAALKEALQQP